jgi:hypothetical protein
MSTNAAVRGISRGRKNHLPAQVRRVHQAPQILATAATNSFNNSVDATVDGDATTKIRCTSSVLRSAGALVGRELTRTNTSNQMFDMLQDIRRRTSAGKASRFLIDPRTSQRIGYWDSVTAVAILFTVFVTPYEVGFLPMAKSAADGLFLVNRAIDLIFITDVVVQFLLIYPVGENTGGTVVWVERPAAIALH